MGIVDQHAQFLQRLDHVDANRAGGNIHALHVEAARGVQRGLDAVAHDDKGRVRDVEMRINAERDRKEGGVSGLRGIAVEKIAVVEVAVGARIGDRLRRLVNGIIVALAQRQRKTPPDGISAMLSFGEHSYGDQRSQRWLAE